MGVTAASIPAPQNPRGFSKSLDDPNQVLSNSGEPAGLEPITEGNSGRPAAGEQDPLQDAAMQKPEGEDANKDSGNSPPKLHAIEETRRAARVMFDPGQVVEVRIPKLNGRYTASGYFDDLEKLAKALQRFSKGAGGIYWTLNPVNPTLLARAKNRIKRNAKHTTGDSDVLRRRWLLVDIDPRRPSGVSAADEEKEKAHLRAGAVKDYLDQLGWPKPVVADSGNGYHLLYRIDLPNNDESTQLIKGILKALAESFDDPVVSIDRSVFNAARICKAYGSMAAKGDSTDERPHRLARLIRFPETLTPVSSKLLRSVAEPEAKVERAPAPTAKISGGITPRRVEEFLDNYGIRYEHRGAYKGGWKWILKECPFDASHTGTSAALFLSADGSLGFKCLHDSCIQHHWEDFRAKLEERTGKKFRFHSEQTRSRISVHTAGLPVIELPEAETKTESNKLIWPVAALEGDYISDYTRLLTDGTQVPPQFVREAIKLCLGAVHDGRVGFPSHENIRTRQFTIVITPLPQGGKDESWRRVAGWSTGLMRELLMANGFAVDDGGVYGSGQYMAKKLEENPKRIGYFSEGAESFKKMEQAGSTLELSFMKLFDDGSLATGSFKNKEYTVRDAQFSGTWNFTLSSFEDSFSGRGSGSNGFLSRCILAYADPIPFRGEWKSRDRQAEQAAFKKLESLIPPEPIDGTLWQPFVPVYGAGAKDLLLDFGNTLERSDSSLAYYRARIVVLTKLDLLYRVIYSGTKEITKEMVERSILWGQHQFAQRQALWPSDRGTLVEAMEQKIIAAFKKNPAGLTAKRLHDACNVFRSGSGGMETFNRAFRALSTAGRVSVVGETRKGTNIYGLPELE